MSTLAPNTQKPAQPMPDWRHDLPASARKALSCLDLTSLNDQDDEADIEEEGEESDTPDPFPSDEVPADEEEATEPVVEAPIAAEEPEDVAESEVTVPAPESPTPTAVE